MQTIKRQVAIVGAGPGGTATAIALAQRGIESVLIEKDGFPRYHVGESLTGECGRMLRQLGLGQAMASPERRHPVKYGVRVVSRRNNSFWVPVMGRTADGELVESSTWQVSRASFDKLMLETACERGALHLKGRAQEVLRAGGDIAGVRVETNDGEMVDVESEVVVDASGMAGFLASAGVTTRPNRGRYDGQVAIFSQVKGAVRDPGRDAGNTLIFVRERHHWAWFIPLDDDRVSIGVVVPGSHFRGSGLGKREFLLREFRELHPELASRLRDASLVESVHALSHFSYHVPGFCGRNYLSVGDSHRFIDAVFSFGVHFAVHEGAFAAEAIDGFLKGHRRDEANPFIDYQRLCERGMDTIQALLDAFWEEPFAFAVAVHVKHREDLIDLFAGRVYSEEPSPGLKAVHSLRERALAREQSTGPHAPGS